MPYVKIAEVDEKIATDTDSRSVGCFDSRRERVDSNFRVERSRDGRGKVPGAPNERPCAVWVQQLALSCRLPH